MHFGIFLEERRRGVSRRRHAARDDRAGGGGGGGRPRRRLARRDPLQRQSLDPVGAAGARELHRRPHPAPPRGHRGAGAPARQSAAHRRGSGHRGPAQRGAPRLRDRAQRLGAHLRLLGVPYGESQARFLESLEVIRLAWKGKPFSYDGEFYRVRNVTVSPAPYQVPHPPLRMAANSPETFPQVARLGLPLFVGLRDLDMPCCAATEGVPGGWRGGGPGRARRTCTCASRCTRRRDGGGRARGAAGGHDLLLPAAHRADAAPASAAPTPGPGTRRQVMADRRSPRCRTTSC